MMDRLVRDFQGKLDIAVYFGPWLSSMDAIRGILAMDTGKSIHTVPQRWVVVGDL
jgi:hypothetical protein